MRRAVVAVIVGGFTFGGIGSGLGHQPVIFGASPTADVRPALSNANLTAVIRAAKKTARKSTEKTISYQGVEFSVPADWPVHWLDKDPDQCVRYDRNAVYVGTPGPDQNCPPGLIGRADTISIGAPSGLAGPTGAAGSNVPVETYQRALVPAKPDEPAKAARSPAAPVPPGTIFQNPELHEFAVAMPSSAPRIYATYGTDPTLVKQTLATVRQIAPQAAPLGSSKRLRQAQGDESGLAEGRTAVYRDRRDLAGRAAARAARRAAARPARRAAVRAGGDCRAYAGGDSCAYAGARAGRCPVPGTFAGPRDGGAYRYPGWLRHLHRPVACDHEGLAGEVLRRRHLHRRPDDGLRLRQPVVRLGQAGRSDGLVAAAHVCRAAGAVQQLQRQGHPESGGGPGNRGR